MDLFSFLKRKPVEVSPMVKELQAKKRDVLKKRGEDELKSILTGLGSEPTREYDIQYDENVAKLREMGFELYNHDGAYGHGWIVYVK